MDVQLAFYVRCLHDVGHFQQYRIVSQSLTHQRRKRAETLRILVRVSRARSIEARRVEFGLHRSNALCRHKKELCCRIEKATDQPASCRAIDSNLLTRDPLHSQPPTSFFRLVVILPDSTRQTLVQVNK